MRYRALDASGDYQFGRSGVFLVNSPEAVAQAIKTRLQLSQGEWFLDTSDGTPYDTEIRGYGTQNTRDLAVQERILDTPGVTELVSYSSDVSAARTFTVAATVETQYGTASLTATITS